MNQRKVTNRELLEAINKNTDKLDGEVLKRLDNIEKEIKGMNGKITSNSKDTYWRSL